MLSLEFELGFDLILDAMARLQGTGRRRFMTGRADRAA